MDEDLVDSDFINKLKEPVNKLKLATYLDIHEHCQQMLQEQKDTPNTIIVDKVSLSNNQKKCILDYVLCCGKGLYEDCEEFWEGMSQEYIDATYPLYREEVDDYLEELKDRLLKELEHVDVQ